MDAECTGCGGRVMPYRQYVFHFRPTAVCGSCGAAVRLRHFSRVVSGTLLVLLAYAVFFALTDSVVLGVAGLALVALGSLLADFWTYRNLPWDPEEESGSGPSV